jgi:hypothetical protein
VQQPRGGVLVVDGLGQVGADLPRQKKPPSIKRDRPGRARQLGTEQVEQHHSGDVLILVSG